MNKRFILLLLLEIFVVAFLLILINKKNKILGIHNVNPIKKETINFNSNSNLKYFFESKPSTRIKEIKTDWVGRDIYYDINADSLHENKDYSEKKEENITRIIALGDSYVFGMFVNTSENWTEVLEDKLNTMQCNSKRRFEVINLGVSGYDIEYSVERYRLRGVKYDPDLVLWMLKDDDFNQPNEIMREKQQEVEEELKTNRSYEKLVKEGQPYPFINVLHEYMANYKEVVGKEYLANRGSTEFKKIFLHYKKPLIIVTFPHIQKEYKNILVKDNPSGFYIEVDGIYHKKNSNLFTFSPNDDHPNREGHKIIANTIIEYLINNNLLNCK